MNKIINNNQISKPQDNVVKDIVNIINTAQVNALRAVNTQLVIRNWLIGKRIDEEILTNRSNDYGKQLIKNLSNQLSKYGKGFNKINLYRFLRFYKCYSNIVSTVRKQSDFVTQKNIFCTVCEKSLLPWVHYRLLIRLNNKIERDWYEKEALDNVWSYRQLERNIKTDYYHRVLSNQIEHKCNKLTKINKHDYFKSLYVFDFLNFKKNQKFKESELEQSLINNLKDFILELGKGYAFVGNQMHLRSNNQDYYVDLVFYNSILKCNVLIDLKVGKIQHKDIGQMLLYLKLFDQQYKQPNDNSPIGIILSSDTNSDVVRYLTLETDNNVVSSKYLTYLPSKEELTKEIKNSKLLLESKGGNS